MSNNRNNSVEDAQDFLFEEYSNSVKMSSESSQQSKSSSWSDESLSHSSSSSSRSSSRSPSPSSFRSDDESSRSTSSSRSRSSTYSSSHRSQDDDNEDDDDEDTYEDDYNDDDDDQSTSARMDDDDDDYSNKKQQQSPQSPQSPPPPQQQQQQNQQNQKQKQKQRRPLSSKSSSFVSSTSSSGGDDDDFYDDYSTDYNDSFFPSSSDNDNDNVDNNDDSYIEVDDDEEEEEQGQEVMYTEDDDDDDDSEEEEIDYNDTFYQTTTTTTTDQVAESAAPRRREPQQQQQQQSQPDYNNNNKNTQPEEEEERDSDEESISMHINNNVENKFDLDHDRGEKADLAPISPRRQKSSGKQSTLNNKSSSSSSSSPPKRHYSEASGLVASSSSATTTAAVSSSLTAYSPFSPRGNDEAMIPIKRQKSVIATDAARMGRLTRLDEHIVESAKEHNDDDIRSIDTWSRAGTINSMDTLQRSVGLLAITEAAAVGKIRQLEAVEIVTNEKKKKKKKKKEKKTKTKKKQPGGGSGGDDASMTSSGNSSSGSSGSSSSSVSTSLQRKMDNLPEESKLIESYVEKQRAEKSSEWKDPALILRKLEASISGFDDMVLPTMELPPSIKSPRTPAGRKKSNTTKTASGTEKSIHSADTTTQLSMADTLNSSYGSIHSASTSASVHTPKTTTPKTPITPKLVSKDMVAKEAATRSVERTGRLLSSPELHVTKNCNCKYCINPSPYQTHAYKQLSEHQKSGMGTMPIFNLFSPKSVGANKSKNKLTKFATTTGNNNKYCLPALVSPKPKDDWKQIKASDGWNNKSLLSDTLFGNKNKQNNNQQEQKSPPTTATSPGVSTTPTKAFSPRSPSSSSRTPTKSSSTPSQTAAAEALIQYATASQIISPDVAAAVLDKINKSPQVAAALEQLSKKAPVVRSPLQQTQPSSPPLQPSNNDGDNVASSEHNINEEDGDDNAPLAEHMAHEDRNVGDESATKDDDDNNINAASASTTLETSNNENNDRETKLEMLLEHTPEREAQEEELDDLLYMQESGDKIDEDRLYELQLYQLYRRGEELSKEEMDDLEYFWDRQLRHQEWTEEFNDLLDRQDNGETIDEDRLYFLELVVRKRLGEELTEEELYDLEMFEADEEDAIAFEKEVAANNQANDNNDNSVAAAETTEAAVDKSISPTTANGPNVSAAASPRGNQNEDAVAEASKEDDDVDDSDIEPSTDDDDIDFESSSSNSDDESEEIITLSESDKDGGGGGGGGGEEESLFSSSNNSSQQQLHQLESFEESNQEEAEDSDEVVRSMSPQQKLQQEQQRDIGPSDDVDENFPDDEEPSDEVIDGNYPEDEEPSASRNRHYQEKAPMDIDETETGFDSNYQSKEEASNEAEKLSEGSVDEDEDDHTEEDEDDEEDYSDSEEDSQFDISHINVMKGVGNASIGSMTLSVEESSYGRSANSGNTPPPPRQGPTSKLGALIENRESLPPVSPKFQSKKENTTTSPPGVDFEDGNKSPAIVSRQASYPDSADSSGDLYEKGFPEMSSGDMEGFSSSYTDGDLMASSDDTELSEYKDIIQDAPSAITPKMRGKKNPTPTTSNSNSGDFFGERRASVQSFQSGWGTVDSFDDPSFAVQKSSDDGTDDDNNEDPKSTLSPSSSSSSSAQNDGSMTTTSNKSKNFKDTTDDPFQGSHDAFSSDGTGFGGSPFASPKATPIQVAGDDDYVPETGFDDGNFEDQAKATDVNSAEATDPFNSPQECAAGSSAAFEDSFKSFEKEKAGHALFQESDTSTGFGNDGLKTTESERVEATDDPFQGSDAFGSSTIGFGEEETQKTSTKPEDATDTGDPFEGSGTFGSSTGFGNDDFKAIQPKNEGITDDPFHGSDTFGSSTGFRNDGFQTTEAEREDTIDRPFHGSDTFGSSTGFGNDDFEIAGSEREESADNPFQGNEAFGSASNFEDDGDKVIESIQKETTVDPFQGSDTFGSSTGFGDDGFGHSLEDNATESQNPPQNAGDDSATGFSVASMEKDNAESVDPSQGSDAFSSSSGFGEGGLKHDEKQAETPDPQEDDLQSAGPFQGSDTFASSSGFGDENFGANIPRQEYMQAETADPQEDNAQNAAQFEGSDTFGSSTGFGDDGFGSIPQSQEDPQAEKVQGADPFEGSDTFGSSTGFGDDGFGNIPQSQEDPQAEKVQGADPFEGSDTFGSSTGFGDDGFGNIPQSQEDPQADKVQGADPFEGSDTFGSSTGFGDDGFGSNSPKSQEEKHVKATDSQGEIVDQFQGSDGFGSSTGFEDDFGSNSPKSQEEKHVKTTDSQGEIVDQFQGSDGFGSSTGFEDDFEPTQTNQGETTDPFQSVGDDTFDSDTGFVTESFKPSKIDAKETMDPFQGSDAFGSTPPFDDEGFGGGDFASSPGPKSQDPATIPLKESANAFASVAVIPDEGIETENEIEKSTNPLEVSGSIDLQGETNISALVDRSIEFEEDSDRRDGSEDEDGFDDDSSLSSREVDELEELLDLQEDGEYIDEKRLYELDIFDRWRNGEDLNDEEIHDVDVFRKRRRKERRIRREFQDLLDKRDAGESVDEGRLHTLQLYARKTIGDSFTGDEAEMLRKFEKEEGLSLDDGSVHSKSEESDAASLSQDDKVADSIGKGRDEVERSDLDQKTVNSEPDDDFLKQVEQDAQRRADERKADEEAKRKAKEEEEKKAQDEFQQQVEILAQQRARERANQEAVTARSPNSTGSSREYFERSIIKGRRESGDQDAKGPDVHEDKSENDPAIPVEDSNFFGSGTSDAMVTETASLDSEEADAIITESASLNSEDSYGFSRSSNIQDDVATDANTNESTINDIVGEEEVIADNDVDDLEFLDKDDDSSLSSAEAEELDNLVASIKEGEEVDKSRLSELLFFQRWKNGEELLETEMNELNEYRKRRRKERRSRAVDTSTQEQAPSESEVAAAVIIGNKQMDEDSDAGDSTGQQSDSGFLEGDDDDSLSTGENDELDSLVTLVKEGEEVDRSRLSELLFFQRWKSGEDLYDNEMDALNSFRKRRRKNHLSRRSGSDSQYVDADKPVARSNEVAGEIDEEVPASKDVHGSSEDFVDQKMKGEDERDHSDSLLDVDDESSLSSGEARELDNLLDSLKMEDDVDKRRLSELLFFQRWKDGENLLESEMDVLISYRKRRRKERGSFHNEPQKEGDVDMAVGNDENQADSKIMDENSQVGSDAEIPLEDDDDSSLSAGELEELDNLLTGVKEGREDVDRKRLSELVFFQKWKSGEFLYYNEMDVVNSFRKRRIKAHGLRRTSATEAVQEENYEDGYSSCSSLSTREIDELEELYDLQDDGEDIDEMRLYELDIFDRHKNGEKLSDEEMQDLNTFKTRRKKERALRREFEDLLEQREVGETVDQERLFLLQLYARKMVGEELVGNEAMLLSKFEKDEGLKRDHGLVNGDGNSSIENNVGDEAKVAATKTDDDDFLMQVERNAQLRAEKRRSEANAKSEEKNTKTSGDDKEIDQAASTPAGTHDDDDDFAMLLERNAQLKAEKRKAEENANPDENRTNNSKPAGSIAAGIHDDGDGDGDEEDFGKRLQRNAQLKTEKREAEAKTKTKPEDSSTNETEQAVPTAIQDDDDFVKQVGRNAQPRAEKRMAEDVAKTEDSKDAKKKLYASLSKDTLISPSFALESPSTTGFFGVMTPDEEVDENDDSSTDTSKSSIESDTKDQENVKVAQAERAILPGNTEEKLEGDENRSNHLPSETSSSSSSRSSISIEIEKNQKHLQAVQAEADGSSIESAKEQEQKTEVASSPRTEGGKDQGHADLLKADVAGHIVESVLDSEYVQVAKPKAGDSIESGKEPEQEQEHAEISKPETSNNNADSERHHEHEHDEAIEEAPSIHSTPMSENDLRHAMDEIALQQATPRHLALQRAAIDTNEIEESAINFFGEEILEDSFESSAEDFDITDSSDSSVSEDSSEHRRLQAETNAHEEARRYAAEVLAKEAAFESRRSRSFSSSDFDDHFEDAPVPEPIQAIEVLHSVAETRSVDESKLKAKEKDAMAKAQRELAKKIAADAQVKSAEVEAARLAREESERLERIRLEKEAAVKAAQEEKARKEAERLERTRLEEEAARTAAEEEERQEEEARLEKIREKARLSAEMEEQQRQDKEAQRKGEEEQERIALLEKQTEAERIVAEMAEAERIAQEKAEAERLAAEEARLKVLEEERQRQLEEELRIQKELQEQQRREEEELQRQKEELRIQKEIEEQRIREEEKRRRQEDDRKRLGEERKQKELEEQRRRQDEEEERQRQQQLERQKEEALRLQRELEENQEEEARRLAKQEEAERQQAEEKEKQKAAEIEETRRVAAAKRSGLFAEKQQSAGEEAVDKMSAIDWMEAELERRMKEEEENQTNDAAYKTRSLEVEQEEESTRREVEPTAARFMAQEEIAVLQSAPRSALLEKGVASDDEYEVASIEEEVIVEEYNDVQKEDENENAHQKSIIWANMAMSLILGAKESNEGGSAKQTTTANISGSNGSTSAVAVKAKERKDGGSEIQTTTAIRAKVSCSTGTATAASAVATSADDTKKEEDDASRSRRRNKRREGSSSHHGSLRSARLSSSTHSNNSSSRRRQRKSHTKPTGSSRSRSSRSSGMDAKAPPRPPISWQDDPKKSFSDWRIEIYHEGSPSDNKVVDVYNIHRNIVGFGVRRSRWFAKEFRRDDAQHNRISRLSLSKQQASSFPSILDFMYYGAESKHAFTAEKACQVFKVAEMFEVRAMEKAIIQFYRKNLSLKNMGKFLNFATNYRADDLALVAKIGIGKIMREQPEKAYFLKPKFLAGIIKLSRDEGLSTQERVEELLKGGQSRQFSIVACHCMSHHESKTSPVVFDSLFGVEVLPFVDASVALDIIAMESRRYQNEPNAELTNLQSRCIEGIFNDWDKFESGYPSPEDASAALQELPSTVLAEILVHNMQRK